MLVELTCLAVDTVITSACYYGYRKCLDVQRTVKDTAALETPLDSSLRTILNQSPDALPYVCISGQVHISGSDVGLLSHYKEGVIGVVQKLLTKEHKAQRIQGYWTDFHKVVRDTLNVVPFSISRGEIRVQVSEPLESRFIRENLTVTHDVYSPKTGSMLVDRIFGDVSKGLRDTERMLKIGTTVLGFGRLVLDSGALRLEKPDNPSHYIVTSLSKPELLRALEEDVTFFKVLTGIFSCAGLVIGYLCLKKLTGTFFNDDDNDDEDAHFLAPIRDARRRRGQVGNEDRAEPQQQCVVCINRPREVVLLDCGHVCLCADCAEEMFNSQRNGRDTCPICRGRVLRIVPIYMA